MHYKKLRIAFLCAAIASSNLIPTCAVYATEVNQTEESSTELLVEESVSEEENVPETEKVPTLDKSEQKKETKEKSKKEKSDSKEKPNTKSNKTEKKMESESEEPIKEIDPIRDVLRSASDNMALISTNRAEYNMPQEMVHGVTDTAKEQIKALKKDQEKQEKEIQKKEKSIQKKQSVKKMVQDLSLKLISTPDSLGQDASIGTLRAIADAQKIPNTTYDKELQNILNNYDSETLKQWMEHYTLDYYVSVDSERQFVTGDTSDILPILTQVEKEIEADMSSVLNEIQKFKDKIQENQEEIEQCKIERIFNPNDVTIPSNLTIDEIHKMLEGTNLDQLSETFLECEKEYEINAVFLMSIAAHESYWGNSRRAREDHNYTGYGVFSDYAEGINADKGEDNIRHTAMKLRENYLNEDGKYYNGVRVCDVHKLYCATGGWSKSVCTHAYTLMERIITEPVYELPKEIQEEKAQDTTLQDISVTKK